MFGLIKSPRFLENFYQHTGLKEATWISLAINKFTIANSDLTKELEILTKTNKFQLEIARVNNRFRHQLWQNKHLRGKTQIDLHSPLLAEFNFLFDQLIENQLLIFQKELNAHISEKEIQAIDRSQDEKALEWIRVSFLVLIKAIEESLTNENYLFQTLFFIGINPKTELLEIRLLTFNLDILFVLLKNGLLRVRIYNDLDGLQGSSKKASLEGDFYFKKREIFDEAIKLIAAHSPGIKIT